MHVHNFDADNQATDKDEFTALVKYMLAHNTSHTNELEKLAENITDNDAAYDNIAKAINSYKNGNEFLAKAIKEMGE